jgi:sensor c-di-GMP phosphodiesterase-like protein
MIDSQSMTDGLARGEFFLEYLPTMKLLDGRCAGAEALIRWRRESVVVEPLDFIPLAENTPLSGLITYWVLDTVADEMGDWLRANPDAHIAVNVPPEIIGRGGIMYAAMRSGLIDLAPQIVLELTERGLPDAIGIEAIRTNARERKIRIAIDDVLLDGGANVALLARAAFDIVKLDRQLVAQIGTDCPHPAWLDEVTALAGLPRLTLVAEGVETAQQLATVRAAGVQYAQGFYCSRPLAAADFMAFHRRSAAGAALPGSTPGAAEE